MPTLIGTTPKWGIEQDETGMIITDIDWDFKIKEVESLNKQGECQGIVLHGETADTAVKAEIPVTDPSTVRLASTLAMSNAMPDHFQVAPTIGRNVVKTVKVGKKRAGFQLFEIGGTFYPLLPVAT